MVLEAGVKGGRVMCRVGLKDEMARLGSVSRILLTPSQLTGVSNSCSCSRSAPLTVYSTDTLARTPAASFAPGPKWN